MTDKLKEIRNRNGIITERDYSDKHNLIIQDGTLKETHIIDIQIETVKYVIDEVEKMKLGQDCPYCENDGIHVIADNEGYTCIEKYYEA